MPFAHFPLVDAVDLRRQVGNLTFARGQEYFRRGLVLGQSISYDPLDMRLFGRVRGTRPSPYECRIWLEATADKVVVEADSGLCSCPVGFDCKHIVALVLAANARSVLDATQSKVAVNPPWSQQLTNLVTAIQAAAAPRELAPVALQLRPAERPNRWWGQPAIEARAVRPGKRGQWVSHGELRWGANNWQVSGVSRAQQRWFEDLNRLANSSYGSSAWLPLTTADSDALWTHLGAGAALGIQLVGEKPQDTVELRALVEPAINICRDAEGLHLTSVVRIDGAQGEVLTDATVTDIGTDGYAAVVPGANGRRMLLGPGDGRGPTVNSAFRVALPVDVPPGHMDDFWTGLYPALARALPVVSTDSSASLPELVEARLLLRITTPSPTRAVLAWRWHYGTASDDDAAGSGAEYPTDASERPGQRWDIAGEDVILARVEAVRASTRSFEDPRSAGLQELSDAALARFAVSALPVLRTLEGLTVIGDLAHVKVRDDEPEIKVTASSASDGDWFDLDVTVQVGDSELPFSDIFGALAAGEAHAMAPDGSLVALDQPVFQKLARLIAEASQLSDRPGKPRIGRYQASLWEDLESAASSVEGADRWRASMASLSRLAEADAVPGPEPLPPGLTARLRPYQKAGYDWLTFVWRHRLGGVLADDMGLGKTVQALAMIARARDDALAGSAGSGSEPIRGGAPFLVVAPSSVVPGGVEEAARFTPGLVVRAASETRARAGVPLEELRAGADVIVTSYAIFRLDNEQFAGLPWSGLLLDEAQFAKNFATKVNQQARALKTDFKLAITGTPMENSLDEFWAIFAITAPGLLGSRKQFKEVYGGPIASGGKAGSAAMAQLRRRAKPLLMRRTKERVAADLPERQEQVLHVELSGRHRELYDTYLQRERSRMLGLLDDYEANRFAILKSLTMLRRAALDVTLVDPTVKSVPSSKLDVLMDQLDQVIGADHRALVFSQFTTYLAKARERLSEAGIDYAYLDGSTTNRASVINGFKRGAAPVFLISLKAGGFGLNLTEADYVFLLDPWWNPATENQAIDRTHRIGQTRAVMVSRLVAQDTIEEKVMALKERKQALFDSLLDQDGAFSGGLTADDVRALVA
ncbi:MAG: DEAD/DEAH box helicase [Bifidobacteriaceae bacterium]|jgi:superfamily II DNA or RNA helicase|nr:DEAD/DEAH box helicase [Bifidobacteriaceae bacterium]